jgi:hypothetical protein
MAQTNSAVERAVDRWPKVISPSTHAALDYLIVGATFLAGAWLWNRNRRAAVTAMAAGVSELGTVLSTKFPGGVFRKMSFPRHAQVSMGQTAALAAAPMLFGFGRGPGAWLFPAHAAIIGIVDAMTDFKAVRRRRSDERILGIGA